MNPVLVCTHSAQAPPAALDEASAAPSHRQASRRLALVMACLPGLRYASAYEPACADGELTAALAERCDRLLASDASPDSVEQTRLRVAGLPHVQVRQAWLPWAWPSERFDLIVVCELARHLGPQVIDALAAKARASLRPGGTLLACHSRTRVVHAALNIDEVHCRLGKRLALTPWTQVLDPELRVDVWCDRQGALSSCH